MNILKVILKHSKKQAAVSFQQALCYPDTPHYFTISSPKNQQNLTCRDMSIWFIGFLITFLDEKNADFITQPMVGPGKATVTVDSLVMSARF